MVSTTTSVFHYHNHEISPFSGFFAVIPLNTPTDFSRSTSSWRRWSSTSDLISFSPPAIWESSMRTISVFATWSPRHGQFLKWTNLILCHFQSRPLSLWCCRPEWTILWAWRFQNLDRHLRSRNYWFFPTCWFQIFENISKMGYVLLDVDLSHFSLDTESGRVYLSNCTNVGFLFYLLI